MIGSYSKNSVKSYHIRDGTEYCFFYLESWDNVFIKLFNKDKTKLWDLNVEFLDEQIARNKKFFFSHLPDKGALLSEWEYIKSKYPHAKLKLVKPELWEVIK